MSRKDGPWLVEGIRTVERAWLSYANRTPLPAHCFWCKAEQTNPRSLLVSVRYEKTITGLWAGWFCESCARERNLIW